MHLTSETEVILVFTTIAGTLIHLRIKSLFFNLRDVMKTVGRVEIP